MKPNSFKKKISSLHPYKETSKSIQKTKLNSNQSENLQKESFEKKSPSTIIKSNIESSLYNLLNKPKTDFSLISPFDLNFPSNYPKIQSLKKLKRNMLVSSKKNFEEKSDLKNEIQICLKNGKKEVYKKINLGNDLKNLVGLDLDFESDSEIELFQGFKNNLENEKKNIHFFENTENCLDFGIKKEFFDSKFCLNFNDFLRERSLRGKFVKIHNCKFCTMTFDKHTALGGHIAKNHPNKSRSYKKKKKNLENKRNERKRISMLRKLQP